MLGWQRLRADRPLDLEGWEGVALAIQLLLKETQPCVRRKRESRTCLFAKMLRPPSRYVAIGYAGRRHASGNPWRLAVDLFWKRQILTAMPTAIRIAMQSQAQLPWRDGRGRSLQQPL